MNHSIQTLYDQTQPTPLPTCVNHPGRETAGYIDDTDHGYCYECIEVELRRRKLWFKSFAVVQGGVEALRP